MMQTDVKSAYITSGGANVYAGPARIKGVYINASGAATVEFTDGGATGTSLLKFTMPASATNNPVYIPLPGEGVKFTTSIYANTASGVNSVTVLYG